MINSTTFGSGPEFHAASPSGPPPNIREGGTCCARYVGREIHVVIVANVNKWSYFEAIGITKEVFGYKGNVMVEN